MAAHIVGRKQEQGSVLIFCLGILVIMSMVATAFVSSIDLMRDISKIGRTKAEARLACYAGKSWVLKVLRDDSANVQTTFNDGWHSKVDENPHATRTFLYSDPASLKDIWRHAGNSDLDDLITFNTNHPDQSQKLETPQWVFFASYSKSGVRNPAPNPTAGYPIAHRFAFSVIDLNGCVRLNPDGALDDFKTPFSELMQELDTANNNCTTAELEPFYKPGYPIYSFTQVRGKVTDLNATESRLNNAQSLNITPFGTITDVNHGWEVNINTASKALIKSMIKNTLIDANSGAVSSAHISNTTSRDAMVDLMTDEIETARNATPFASIEAVYLLLSSGSVNTTITGIGDDGVKTDTEKVVNLAVASLFPGSTSAVAGKDYDDSNTTIDTTTPPGGGVRGGAFVTDVLNKFFRVVVRGQICDDSDGNGIIVSSEVVYEDNLEFVYCKPETADPYIMYQRWLPTVDP